MLQSITTKKVFVLAVVLMSLVKTQNLFAQVSGIKTIPGDYATITAALNHIKSVGLSGHVILELQQSYYWHNEFYPLTIPENFPTSVNATLTIRPAAGATGVYVGTGFLGGGPMPTGNIPIFNIYGYYINLDGRPGGVGTGKELYIWSQAPEGSAVQFTNNAAYNKITHCNLLGINDPAYDGGTGAKRGIVSFLSQGLFPVGIIGGTNNNTIENCVFDGAIIWRPAYAVYAKGPHNMPNIDNKILNNEFKNFLKSGIDVTDDGPGSGWTISGNSFYNSSADSLYPEFAINLTHSSVAKCGVNIIENNFIGGNAAQATGKWLGGPMFGIVANTFAGGVSTTVKNNVIKNLVKVNSKPYPSFNNNDVFAGISVTNSNGRNLLDVTGNLIGGNVTDFGISVNAPATGGDASFYGILYNNCSRGSVSNNTIQYIKMTSAESSTLLGIKTEILNNVTVSGNLIQNLDIQSTGTNTVVAMLSDNEFVIPCESIIDPAIFNDNLIDAVLVSSDEGSSNFFGIDIKNISAILKNNAIGVKQITAAGQNVVVNGLLVEGKPGNVTFTNGTITNLIGKGIKTAAVNGIYTMAEGTVNISNNKITNLIAPSARGIYIAPIIGSSTVTVEKNEIAGNGSGSGIEINVAANTSLKLTAKGNSVSQWLSGFISSTGTGGKLDAMVNGNSISGNKTGFNNKSTTAITATCNWWGDASGPGGKAGGKGDVVIGSVVYKPWAAAANFISVNAGADQTIYIGYGSTSATLTPAVNACGILKYQWSNGATTASITVSPTVTTTYTLTITDENGYAASDNVVVNVKDIRCGKGLVYICHNTGKTKITQCVKTTDVPLHLSHGDVLGTCSTIKTFKQQLLIADDEDNNLTVFPNPSNGNIQVQWHAAKEGKATIKVIDILGRTVLNQSVAEIKGENSKRLRLEKIKSGNFIVMIISDSRSQTAKFIIQ